MDILCVIISIIHIIPLHYIPRLSCMVSLKWIKWRCVCVVCVPPGSLYCRDGGGLSCLSMLWFVSLPSAWLFLSPSVSSHRCPRYFVPKTFLSKQYFFVLRSSRIYFIRFNILQDCYFSFLFVFFGLFSFSPPLFSFLFFSAIHSLISSSNKLGIDPAFWNKSIRGS